MMYSDNKKLIFIHIYKTGGTSITASLLKYCDKPFAKHSLAERIRKALGDKRFDSYFKFSCVRNPWDRMVSIYTYRLERGYTDESVSFQEFVENFKVYESNPLFRCPQIRWLQIKSETVVDEILRFETLGRDFNSLMKRLKLSATLPHLNKSRHKSYLSYYNPQTKKIVEDLFQSDIETFKYTFRK